MIDKKKIEKAWEAFFVSNATTTIEAMNAEGWKTIEQIAKATGKSERTINKLAYSDTMETEKKRVPINGATRMVVFMRPKV
jgi:hypothetical protein